MELEECQPLSGRAWVPWIRDDEIGGRTPLGARTLDHEIVVECDDRVAGREEVARPPQIRAPAFLITQACADFRDEPVARDR